MNTKQTETRAQYLILQREFKNLKDDYENLYDKYTALRQETSENTIIESMNDMKIQYQELLKNTVPKEKYNNLLVDYDKLCSVLSAINVLIENLSKHVNNTDFSGWSRLYILQEILNDAIKETRH